MKMNTVWAIVVVGIVAVLGIWYWTSHMGTGPALVGDTASSTPVSTMQTLSFNDLTLAYSSSEFALATTPEQVTVKSYIPPCDQGFNYCFFYKGSAYAGTNFESAGLRIQKRADLATAAACLSTPPSGYTNMKPVMASTTEYTLSTFTPLGDAGAGHYSFGSLYRLSYGGNCYEFQTRIGATQFGNYPTGSIREFTPTDQDAVNAMLKGVLRSITTASGAKPFAAS
jgi:hypothetical protein